MVQYQHAPLYLGLQGYLNTHSPMIIILTKQTSNTLTTNIKGDWRKFIGSKSPPPTVAPVLHSTNTDELVQGLCSCSVWLQSYRLYITMVGLSSCQAVTDAILLWFFFIHAVAALVLVALLALDN